ncbi:unnamed protein product [Jaminaea pallidilutea]
MSTPTSKWCGGVMLESISAPYHKPPRDPILWLHAASHTTKAYKIGRHPEGSPEQPFKGPALHDLLMNSKVISRDHAEIRVSLNGLTAFCTDLGSTHGTYLRRGSAETRLTAHRAVTILSGDILCFGKEVVKHDTTYPASEFRVHVLKRPESLNTTAQSTPAPKPVVAGGITSASIPRAPVTASNMPSASASAAPSCGSSIAPRTTNTVNRFGPRSSSAVPTTRDTPPYTKGAPSSASPEPVGFRQGSYGLTTKEQLAGDDWPGIKSEAGSVAAWRPSKSGVPAWTSDSSSAMTSVDHPILAEGKLPSLSPAVHAPQTAQDIAQADGTGSAGLETPADMPEPAASASAAEHGVASDTDRETTQVSYAQVVAGTGSSNDQIKEPEGQQDDTCNVSEGESTTPASANDAAEAVEPTTTTASTANVETASPIDPTAQQEAAESPSPIAGRKRSFDEAHDNEETGDHTIVADPASSAAVTSQPTMTTAVSAPQSRFKRIRISRARARDIAVGMATGAIGTFFSLAFCGARYLE